jgi:FlaA1/EpsC-like NDP-sugar epimerase
VLYSGSLAFSWIFAYLLRFDFSLPSEVYAQCVRLLTWIIVFKLLLLLAFRQFASLLSYFSLPDAQRVFTAMLIAGCGAYGLHQFGSDFYSPPRSVVLTDFIISFTFLSGLRLALRMLRERFQRAQGNRGKPVRRIGIIGAGDVGANLVKDFLARPSLSMRAVAFGDDSNMKWHTSLHGVPVVGSPEFLIEKSAALEIDEIVIAMPSASPKRVRELVAQLTARKIKSERVPSMEQLINGNVRVSQLRPIEIQDLLGRDPVNLQADRIRELVRGKVVMVTGAGGSIGSELCRQIASYSPRQLLLVERSEFLLFQIEQELIELGLGSNITPLVVNITDPEQTGVVFRRFAPTVIFHAAAHKHVPMMEQQPAEAFANNTLGTRLLANLALTHKVERFVLISTDKAINPTNVMGATKRMAELYLQALQMEIRSGEKKNGGQGTEDRGQRTEAQNPSPYASGLTPPSAALPLTKFMAVRFGNVLGSSGSVIPTFKKQIAAGGPVTVTHPEMTRYFMTVNEAVGLVLQSATLGEGGEIFVLDMGQPMKIVDLARQLIELSGLNPDTDIEIRFTGLRPGEKLYEELNHKTENMVATEHAKVMRFIGAPQPLDHLQAGLAVIQTAAATQEAAQVKLAIQKLVPEYQPQLGTV